MSKTKESIQQDTVKPVIKHSVIKNLFRSLKIVREFDKNFLPLYLFLNICANALPFAVTWYTAVFINKVTEGSFSGITDPALLVIIVMYISLPVIEDLIRLVKDQWWHTFYLKFSEWLEIKYINVKARVDVQTYEGPDFNNLMTKVKENSYKFTNFIYWFFDIFGFGVQLILAIVIIATYAWWIALVLFIALLPDMWVEYRYGKRTWGIWEAKASVKRRYYEIGGHFSEVSSLIEMKVSQAARYLIHALKSMSDVFMVDQIKNIHIKTKFKSISTLILAVIMGGVIIYIMNDVIVGTLAIGTFVFIISSMGRLQNNLSNFLRGVSTMSTDNLFVDDVHAFLNTPNALKNGTIVLTPSTSGIEFEQVSFAYPGSSSAPVVVSTESTSTSKQVFKNITFTIKPGEKIAMVGVNGAGKTTLTKLLMRFYDPTEGKILIGGHDIKNIDIDTYYKKIGYLSQEYDRFKFSVQEAIGMGDTTHPFIKEKVIDAAKKARAHEFIMEWSGGYDTQLGKEFDGGVEPSIGQWQKLALARLFYRNPDIWILDEPTASIDAVAEMEIFQELERLPKDKTVILISHRFNTVKNADRIMVIEHGEIVEFASHEALMQIPHGIYRTLFTKQKDSFSDSQ
jgi:ABC-type multidrug transport system fused ATPase/permease subunit